VPGGPPQPIYPPPPPGWRALPPPPPGYHYVPVPPPTPLSPAGVPLADFGQRVAAYIIDMALLAVVGLIFAVPALFLLIHKMSEPVVLSQDTAPDLFFLRFLLFELGFVVLLMLLYYLYAVEYMHRSGQTIGKKIMKIRIVPIDPSRTLTRWMATKRYLVEYVAGTFIPFFRYLDGLWQLVDKPFQQALHDKVAQTVVVKVSA
jgi:uncharacterized RDD family membrane protein YckC